MTAMKRNLLVVLFVIAIVLLIGSAAHACPMCKDSLATAKNDLKNVGGASVGGGFNNSIYLMLLGFFGAVGIVAFNVIRGIRR
jgi:ABC-type anion transport system duplicated permease subunit